MKLADEYEAKNSIHSIYKILSGMGYSENRTVSKRSQPITDRDVHQNDEVVQQTVDAWPTVTKFAIFKLKGRKAMFYVTTHAIHFVYSHMASDI